jgi:hypothetical protein
MFQRSLPLVGAVLVGLTFVSTSAVAQSAPSAAPAVPQAAALDPAAQVATLREEQVAAQQEIVRLRAQVANQQDLEAALKATREKNERLIAITNELIAAYAKRYQRGQYLPFDTGRRKFEAELQDLGDRAYDNRWDAGPRRATPAPAGSAPMPSAEAPRQNDQ